MLASVVLYEPGHPRFLALRGYEDYAKAIVHGLRLLGLDAHLTINTLLKGADVTFVFGGHLMAVDDLKQLGGTVYFVNLEQHIGTKYFDLDTSKFTPSYQYAMQNFKIIDYSAHNMAFWDKHPLRYPVILLPPGYADSLILPPQHREDIDVLFFGGLGSHFSRGDFKQRFLRACAGSDQIKPRIVLMQNDYDTLRDEFIMRSKIIISVTGQSIFPMARAQIALANHKALISSWAPSDLVDEFFNDHIVFCDIDTVEDVLFMMLTDDQFRRDYADHCANAFKKIRVEDQLRQIMG